MKRVDHREALNTYTSQHLSPLICEAPNALQSSTSLSGDAAMVGSGGPPREIPTRAADRADQAYPIVPIEVERTELQASLPLSEPRWADFCWVLGLLFLQNCVAFYQVAS
jgi:hypothetical protein